MKSKGADIINVEGGKEIAGIVSAIAHDDTQSIASRVFRDKSTSDVLKGADAPILARHPTKASLAAIAAHFHGAHEVPLVLVLRDALERVESPDLDEVLLAEFRRPFDGNERFGLLVLMNTEGRTYVTH